MAWTAVSANGYKVATETGIAIADSAGANVVTAYSSVINDDLSNKKFVVYLEVTEASAGDGAYDVSVLGSHDGTTFVVLDADVIDDVDPTGLNKKSGLADLTNIYAPYYKLEIQTDGTDTVDAAAVKVSYAFK